MTYYDIEQVSEDALWDLSSMSICKANKKVRICRTFDKNSANIKSKAKVAILLRYVD